MRIVGVLSLKSSYSQTVTELEQIKLEVVNNFTKVNKKIVGKHLFENIENNILLILDSLISMNKIINSGRQLDINGEIYPHEYLNRNYKKNIDVLISNYNFIITFLNIISGVIPLMRDQTPLEIIKTMDIDMLDCPDNYYRKY